MKKNMMWVWILIVLVVIAGAVYFTINKKGAVTEEQNKMTNGTEGVKVTVLNEGTGDAAVAGDTVSMNYTGRLVDGTVFDSNVDPKFNHVQPFGFKLGTGQVIKGWDVGVAGMKVGEKRTLEISSDNAYGATGVEGVIPPNATLVFDVELLSITK